MKGQPEGDIGVESDIKRLRRQSVVLKNCHDDRQETRVYPKKPANIVGFEVLHQRHCNGTGRTQIVKARQIAQQWL
jgi:hypothetical protein